MNANTEDKQVDRFFIDHPDNGVSPEWLTPGSRVRRTDSTLAGTVQSVDRDLGVTLRFPGGEAIVPEYELAPAVPERWRELHDGETVAQVMITRRADGVNVDNEALDAIAEILHGYSTYGDNSIMAEIRALCAAAGRESYR